MKKVTLLLGLLLFLIASVSAQEESFQPSGKPFMRVFSNFNTTFTDGNSTSAFALDRAYLGYGYNFSKQFSGKLNIDIGNPGVGGLEMTAFIKNAFLNYHTEKLTVEFGLIGTTSFKVMEGLWGNRYIEKSFQDAYKFNSSADLGLSVAYSLTKWLDADLMIVNGEGYKKLQADNQFKTGLGLTLMPVESITLRGYYDFMGSTHTQSTTSLGLGYSVGKLVAAAEFNIQQNVANNEGETMFGTSVSANYSPINKVKVFARYDFLSSNTLTGAETNWNNSKDGQLVIVGIEYQPVKGIKLSPNFRLWNPADAVQFNVAKFFISCEIKI